MSLSRLKRFLWKRKGYKLLDGFDTGNPQSGDLKVLAHMRLANADLSKPRHVLHYLYFATAAGREAAEQQLREHGYETRHGGDYGAVHPKCLVIERHGIVNESLIAEERKLLQSVVKKNDGNYDGWEAALD